MKNIHVLPTDKPSNLLLCIKSYTEHKDTPAEDSENKGNFRLGFGIYTNTEFYQHQHIYITNSEKIKEGDWRYNSISNTVYQKKLDKISFAYEYKIILTTDPDLIKNGVQAIDDEFLEWFVKNPSCESVEVKELLSNSGNAFYGYKIIIPKEEPRILTVEAFNKAKISYKEPKQDEIMERFIANAKQQETLEEFIEKEGYPEGVTQEIWEQGVREGSAWQQERSYSEEDMKKAFIEGHNVYRCVTDNIDEAKEIFVEWFNKLKRNKL